MKMLPNYQRQILGLELGHRWPCMHDEQVVKLARIMQILDSPVARPLRPPP